MRVIAVKRHRGSRETDVTGDTCKLPVTFTCAHRVVRKQKSKAAIVNVIVNGSKLFNRLICLLRCLDHILGPNRSNAPRSRAVWVSGSARPAGHAAARPRTRGPNGAYRIRCGIIRAAPGGGGAETVVHIRLHTYLIASSSPHLHQRSNTREACRTVIVMWIELSNAERQQQHVLSNLSSNPVRLRGPRAGAVRTIDDRADTARVPR